MGRSSFSAKRVTRSEAQMRRVPTCETNKPFMSRQPGLHDLTNRAGSAEKPTGPSRFHSNCRVAVCPRDARVREATVGLQGWDGFTFAVEFASASGFEVRTASLYCSSFPLARVGRRNDDRGDCNLENKGRPPRPSIQTSYEW